MSEVPETGMRTTPRNVEARDEARQDRNEDRKPMGRGNRIPLGSLQSKLTADVPKGMVGRWVNDTPGRIDRALQAGYQFINDRGQEAKNRSTARKVRVGTQEGGKELNAYLMAIPEHFYREDQAAKETEIRKMDEAIKRGTQNAPDSAPGAAPEDKGKFYNAGISHDPGGH